MADNHSMRALRLVLILPMLLLFTGCVKFDLDLVINSDSTVSGTMIFAVSDALSSLGEDEESSQSDVTDELVNPNTKGVTVEEYDQGGFSGQKIVLDRVPFSEFQKGGESGDLTISREGNKVTLKGFLDLSMEDSGGAEDEFSQAIANSLFASADLQIRVTFPAEVVTTTGELSEDRRTVTWEPKIGDRVDLTTTVQLPKPPVFIFVGLGLLLALLLILSFFIVQKRKKKLINLGSDETKQDPQLPTN